MLNNSACWEATQFYFGSFTSVSLTRTHYSNLPLIQKPAQKCPSAVMCTYRNALPLCFRPVKGVWPSNWRFLDNLPLPPCVTYKWDRVRKNKKEKHFLSPLTLSTLSLTYTWDPTCKCLVIFLISLAVLLIGRASYDMWGPLAILALILACVKYYANYQD